MRDIPKPMEQYVHFKGGRYQILNLAEMEETGETLVIYQALYGEGKIYARPLENFLSEVDRGRYPDAAVQWRFRRVVPPEESVPAARNSREQPDAPAQHVPEESSSVPEEAGEEEPGLDPVVLRFLDADSADEKLDVLSSERGRITNEMIDTMAFALGLEIEPGPVDDRYLELRECLLTISRYELDRGRLRSSM